jgi:hypothetical protein
MTGNLVPPVSTMSSTLMKRGPMGIENVDFASAAQQGSVGWFDVGFAIGGPSRAFCQTVGDWARGKSTLRSQIRNGRAISIPL